MQTAIDHDPLAAPEQVAWKKHHRAIAAVPAAAGWWRGCFGLAAVVTGGADAFEGQEERIYLPDAAVTWASMLDLAASRFEIRGGGGVTWASVRPTANRLGVPTLAPHTPGGQGWNYGLMPQTATGGLETLPLGPCAVLAKVFNALQWEMTAYAHWSQPAWRRNVITKALKRLARPPVLPPEAWMPVPYLGFPAASLPRLYRRVTRPGLMQFPGGLYYPPGLRAEFVKALSASLAYRASASECLKGISRTTHEGVPCLELTLSVDGEPERAVRFSRIATVHAKPGPLKAGDLVATEAMNCVAHGDPLDVWDRRIACLPAAPLDAVMRFWFDRQAVSLAPGFIHLPARLASVAALGSATGPLFWGISHASNYFRSDCDAFVFPAVPMTASTELTGSLPHDVAYDLTPDTPRFVRGR